MVFQRIAAVVGVLLTAIAGIAAVGTLLAVITEPRFAVTVILAAGFLGVFLAQGGLRARTTATEYW